MAHIQQATQAMKRGTRWLIKELERWASEPGSDDECISPPGTRSNEPWLWAKNGLKLLKLNADTNRHGVKTFLAQLKSTNKLRVTTNQNGSINKVVVAGHGPIPGFYLYTDAAYTTEMDLSEP